MQQKGLSFFGLGISLPVLIVWLFSQVVAALVAICIIYTEVTTWTDAPVSLHGEGLWYRIAILGCAIGSVVSQFSWIPAALWTEERSCTPQSSQGKNSDILEVGSQ